MVRLPNASECIDKLKENETGMIGCPPGSDQMCFAIFDLEKANSLLSQNQMIFSMVMMTRPGASVLARYLELKYFHPSSKNNDLFVCLYHKWGGMIWSLLGVPKALANEEFDGEAYLREAIDFAELRVCEPGYIPMMIGGGLEENTQFGDVPASKPNLILDNILYLENKFDSLAYKNRDDAFKVESRKIAEVEREFL